MDKLTDEILSVIIDAHAFNGYEYFHGTRPNVSAQYVREHLDEVIGENGDTWGDFLWVNGITAQ